jgi:hypothetical protein
MKKSFILILASGILTMGSFAFSLETERKAPSQLRKIDPRKLAGLKKPGIKKAPALARKAPDAGKLEAFGKSLKDAIAAGKLTEDEAKAKWDALTKGRGNKKPAEGKRDLGKGKKPPTDAKRPLIKPQVKRPAKPELSDETKAQLEAIKKDKDALKTAIGDELEKLGLGKDSSKEDVRAAVEAFRNANKDRFEAIKEASEKVHETLKAARPERKKRPEPTPEIKSKIAAVKAVGKKLHESRGNLRKELKDASDENRKALIEKFKADNKDKHEELKAAHKELKEAVRAAKETGDSRTSD